MNQPTRTRPGHWADVPTPTDPEEPKPSQPLARVSTRFVALLLAVALAVWLARFFLTKG